jgi:hypothetical protein
VGLYSVKEKEETFPSLSAPYDSRTNRQDTGRKKQDQEKKEKNRLLVLPTKHLHQVLNSSNH